MKIIYDYLSVAASILGFTLDKVVSYCSSIQHFGACVPCIEETRFPPRNPGFCHYRRNMFCFVIFIFHLELTVNTIILVSGGTA